MRDKELTCSDCNGLFIFSAREQKFFEDKGFIPPKRCVSCRRKRRENDKRNENR